MLLLSTTVMLVVEEGVDEKYRHIYMLKWQQKWCGLRREQKSVEGGPRIQNNGERGLLWGEKNKEKDICTWDSPFVLKQKWSPAKRRQRWGRCWRRAWRSGIASERSCKGSPEMQRNLLHGEQSLETDRSGVVFQLYHQYLRGCTSKLGVASQWVGISFGW